MKIKIQAFVRATETGNTARAREEEATDYGKLHCIGALAPKRITGTKSCFQCHQPAEFIIPCTAEQVNAFPIGTKLKITIETID